MKITIITAAYNSGATLQQAIDSVRHQSYKNIEHLIVDGNSTDGSLDLIKANQHPGLRYISEPDRGLYDALNKGIEMATGDVIGFLHADDVFAGPEVLLAIAEVFKYYDTDSCYGNLVYVKKNDLSRVVRVWKSGKYSPKKMQRGWMPPHPTFYARRAVYQRFGSFNLKYHISSDYECLLRLLGKHRINTFYLPMVFVKMRLGGTSNKSFRNILKKSFEDIRAMRENNLNFIPAILYKNLSKVNQFVQSSAT